MIKLYLHTGDFEYMRDAYYWWLWIAEYVTEKFEIKPTNKDFVILQFEHKEDEVIFKLKSPEYITHDLVENLFKKDKRNVNNL